MDQETKDLLFGAAVLIPFLIAVFAAGFVISRFKNRRFTAAWAPLVPIIGGKVVDDGGGAATSWLTGTFQGRSVHAVMIPNRRDPPGGQGRYLTVAGAGSFRRDLGSMAAAAGASSIGSLKRRMPS
jgi:hypothetical protein